MKKKKIISAMVSPLTEHGTADVDSAKRVLEYGMSNRLDGFFLFGSMGEGIYLSRETKQRLAEAACEVVQNKSTLILGVHSETEQDILKNINTFKSYSHDYYTSLLPHKDKLTLSPVETVFRLADECDRPFFLYYLPQANKINFTPDEFARILTHPNVAGVKNSSSSMLERKELILLKKSINFQLFEGCEWAVDEAFSVGCDGAIVGFGSLGGALFRQMADAFHAHNLEEAKRLQMVLIDAFHNIYGAKNVCSIIGQKYGLYKLGYLTSFKTLNPRQQKLTKENQNAIDKYLAVNKGLFYNLEVLAI